MHYEIIKTLQESFVMVYLQSSSVTLWGVDFSVIFCAFTATDYGST